MFQHCKLRTTSHTILRRPPPFAQYTQTLRNTLLSISSHQVYHQCIHKCTQGSRPTRIHIPWHKVQGMQRLGNRPMLSDASLTEKTQCKLFKFPGNELLKINAKAINMYLLLL